MHLCISFGRVNFSWCLLIYDMVNDRKAGSSPIPDLSVKWRIFGHINVDSDTCFSLSLIQLLFYQAFDIDDKLFMQYVYSGALNWRQWLSEPVIISALHILSFCIYISIARRRLKLARPLDLVGITIFLPRMCLVTSRLLFLETFFLMTLRLVWCSCL